MAATLVFSGSQLIMLGVIGEYVGRAFMTVAGKTQSLIREVLHNKPAIHAAAPITPS